MYDAPSLIIDCNYLAYQARYTLGRLSHQDIPTGTLFGFLSRIMTLGLSFNTDDLIFCWDSSKSLRKTIFPAYKKHTKEMSEEDLADLKVMKKQVARLRDEILPTFGFTNHMYQVGYEADDMIASVCQTSGAFVIVSADEDLFQLLKNNVRMYIPSKKKMMTKKRFVEEYGIPPHEWSVVKALAGCSSDKIPPLVRGCGEKTVLKYMKGLLKENEERDAILGSCPPDRFSLVCLPLEGAQSFKRKPNKLSYSAFKEVSLKLGFHSFLQGEVNRQWKTFFTIGAAEQPRIKGGRRG